MAGLFRHRPSDRQRHLDPTPLFPAGGAYYDAVIADGATWYARLGESSGLPQDSIGGNHATVVNGTPTYGVHGLLVGNDDTAIQFDGTTSESFDFPDGAYADLGDANWTIEMIIRRMGSFGANQTILTKGTNAYGIGIDTGNRIGLNKTGVSLLDNSLVAVDDTAWHHIAITRGASNATVIYVDGVDVTFHQTNATIVDGSSVLSVGCEAGFAGFDGVLDEVAIYKGIILTAAQVANHYLLAFAGAYAAQVVTDGPVWYGRLGESAGATVAVDEIAGLNGTYVNTPTIGVAGALVGHPDTAVSFDRASTEYVTVADDPTLDFGTADFSLEIWFKLASVADGFNKWLMSKGSQFGFFIRDNGNLCLDNFGSHAANSNVSVDVDLLWHHAVATRTGSTYKLYFDGVDVTGTTAAQTFTANADAMTIGIENDIAAPFNGSLDEPAAYAIVLTHAQVLDHYLAGRAGRYAATVLEDSPAAYWRLDETSGTFVEDIVGSSDGTYIATPTLGEAGGLLGWPGKSVRLTAASSEYISIADAAPLDVGDVFTLEIWVKRATISAYQYVFSKGLNGPIVAIDSSNRIDFSIGDGVTIKTTAVSVATDTTEWHHIVVTKDGAAAFIYYDGVDVTVANSSATVLSNALPLSIGDGGVVGEEWNGWLDEAAIYPTALSPERVLAHYGARGHGIAPYWDEVLADLPAVLVKANEASGNLVDTMVGNDAVVSGTALTYQVAGPDVGIPYGVTFAAASLGTIADGSDVDLSNGPFTIELWLKRITTGVDYTILGKSGAYFVEARVSAPIPLLDDTVSTDIFASGGTNDTTSWHHYVWTRADGYSGKAYWDGIDSTTLTGRSFIDSANALLIGGGGVSFHIAAIAIYKFQLGADRVHAHYEARLIAEPAAGPDEGFPYIGGGYYG